MDASRARFTLPLLIATIAFLTTAAGARIVAVANDYSVADALTHVEAWIKAHPKEPAGYRTLARIHALAFAYGEKIPLVGTSARDALPTFTEDSTVLVSRTAPREALWTTKAVPPGNRPDRPLTADDAKHLSASVVAYQKALELDPTDGLSELGLGWMLAQQGLYAREIPADFFGDHKPTAAEKAAWAESIRQLADDKQNVRDAAGKTLLAAMPQCALALRNADAKDPPTKARLDAILQTWFDLQSLEHYRKAYILQADVDVMGAPDYQADSQISAKAGAQILAILARHPEAETKDESKTIRETLEPLAKKRQSLMTQPQ